MVNKVFLGLGSNVGDRYQSLNQATELLKHYADGTIQCSGIYETEPVGPQDQDSFLNLVISFQTTENVESLLTIAKNVENSLGRKFRKHWGPREIDVDILYFNSDIISLDFLVVPHPEISNRQFVLRPLSDLEPDFIDPHHQKTIQQMLHENMRLLGEEKMKCLYPRKEID